MAVVHTASIVLVYWASMALCVALPAALGAAIEPAEGPWLSPAATVAVLLAYGVFASAAYALLRAGGAGRETPGSFAASGRTALGLTAFGLGALCAFPLSWLGGGLLRLDAPPPSHSLWGTAAISIVVAPVIEELIFRGALHRRLRVRCSAPATNALCALGFASCHGTLAAFTTALAVGLGLGAVRERTGSLLPCVLGHAGVNAAPYLLLGASMQVG